MCLTIKHLMVILCGLCFAQAAMAMAPLCSRVLLSISPGQIDSTIEAFARLSMETDQIQAMGLTDIRYSSMRSAQREKELELLSTLNITREQLQKLVQKKNREAHKKLVQEVRKEASARENERKLVFPYTLKKTIPNNLSKSYDYSLAPNGSRLAVLRRHQMELINFTSGKSKFYRHDSALVFHESIFQFGKKKNSATITNLNDGSRFKIPLNFSDPLILVSSERNSILFYEIVDGQFRYLQLNSKGEVLREGAVSIHHLGDPKLGDPKIEMVHGDNFVIRSASLALYRFSTITKDFAILPASEHFMRGVPQTNSIIVQNGGRYSFDMIDLEYLYRTPREFDDYVSISYIDKDIAWLRDGVDSGNLKKINLRDPTAPTETVNLSRDHLLEKIPGTDLLSLNEPRPEKSELQTGIYNKSDLSAVFSTSHVYALNFPSRKILRQWVSDEGKTITIHFKDLSSESDLIGIDVWRRP